MIGLDALSPKLVERFADDGTCPNFKRVISDGGFSKALEAIPAQTPENWTTIATGSWPGTHGIAVWGRHDYGKPVTEKHGGIAMSSILCKAEYLWEAAARQGLRSVLLNFIGYPPTTEMTIYVDWFWQPNHYYFEICRNAVYVHPFQEERLKKDSRRYMIPVEFKRSNSLIHTSSSRLPPLEAKINVAPKYGGKGVGYWLLLLDSKGEGYDRCLISKERGGRRILCILKNGEWSGWYREEFTVQDRRIVGTVRFKLVELSRDGRRFKLYRSQVYPVSGFTYPPNISNDLVERFGPYINEASSRPFYDGLIDEETFREEIEYQVDWISKAAQYLMNKNEASLFMMHWHLLDSLQHSVLGMADPAGGEYDPERSEEAWRLLRLGYRLADRLIGSFMECVDDETYLIVVSDHGNVPNRKMYSIVKALAERGLIEIEEGNGEEKINWSKSKVFLDLTNVYVNLRGRYVGGVVSESEYEEVRWEVIDTLRSCKDQDGEYIVVFALKREDAPIIGLWGEHVGDVIFTYSPGFTWGNRLFDGGSLKVGGANHGPQIPTSETEISSNYAVFMMIGGETKRGYIRPTWRLGPVQLVDVAPTIAYILGIDPPRHSQGRILYDFFRGWDISDMKREWKTLEIQEEISLVGDVTDEGGQ